MTFLSPSGLQLVPGSEYPAHDRYAQREKGERGAGAHEDVDVGDSVEAPPESADEIDDRVEEGDLLPDRRQHAHRVERPAEEGERRDDHERSEEHTSELQSQSNLVCRLLLEKKNK